MKIMVMYGGISEEREVSLSSGGRVCEALRKKGHDVCAAQVDTELPDAILLRQAAMADAVFLCLHGGAGEDGRWQTLLEKEGILHYTGSGPAASALAMDKPRAKACVQAMGVPTAAGCVWQKDAPAPDLPFPFIVKPCKGGSSVGFRIFQSEKEQKELMPSEDLLCEAYLPGREYSVAVWKGHALPPVEIRPLGGVYDYAHKYETGASEEICPAPLGAVGLSRLQNLALVSFYALGLRDFARVDFKENARGEPCFLEANTLPGMTATSLFPLAARAANIPMEALCEQMAELAAGRKG